MSKQKLCDQRIFIVFISVTFLSSDKLGIQTKYYTYNNISTEFDIIDNRPSAQMCYSYQGNTKRKDYGFLWNMVWNHNPDRNLNCV